MPAFGDLPASAVRLITRFARTRPIPGTNRFARISRSWRDAVIESDPQEQLQLLLLALEALPADSVRSIAHWLSWHGQCTTSLHITYNPGSAPLFQQLPLSSPPLAGLVRLEVDGPDSLVALAPALPQLVALTHLRASIGLIPTDSSPLIEAQGVFSAGGLPLEAPPCLQQLCPGLKRLHLDIDCRQPVGQPRVRAPLAELLPDGLEQLYINRGSATRSIALDSAALAPLTALRRLTVEGVALDPDPLFHMPALVQLELCHVQCGAAGDVSHIAEWLAADRCTAPQQLTKLSGASLVQLGPASAGMQALAAAVPGVSRLEVAMLQSTILQQLGGSTAAALLQQLGGSTAAALVQQLVKCGSLRHLDLTLYGGASGDVAAAVLALSSLQQLTYLRLSIHEAGGVPRTTWAELLPHLPQLRVLGVTQELLDGGLAAEVAQLPQLQCLYIKCNERALDPAGVFAQVAPHLQALSECSSLKAVLCWGGARDAGQAAQPLQECVHEGRLHLSCWHKWRQAADEGLVVCPRPCPHLPGVWELQQEEAAGVSSSNQG